MSGIDNYSLGLNLDELDRLMEELNGQVAAQNISSEEDLSVLHPSWQDEMTDDILVQFCTSYEESLKKGEKEEGENGSGVESNGSERLPAKVKRRL